MRKAFALTVFFSLLLCGCGREPAPVEEPASPETTMQPQISEILYSTALEAYEALWSGSGSFAGCGTEVRADLYHLEGLYDPAPRSVIGHSFSILDLNRDGTEEMILYVNLEYPDHTLYNTPLLLWFQDGSLYGQVIPYEDFREVKADGTFLFWHPEEGDLGYATMTFADGVWRWEAFAEALSDENWEMFYSVNGEAATQEDYHRVELEQDSKPDVLQYSDWYRYQEESNAQPSVPADADAALDAFRRVLEGRLPIYRIASQEYIPISKISLFFTVEELPWEVVRFAVQDLDGDGVPDAVLEVSDSMGYVILHYREDGIVTGEEIWYRAFQDLKADGSYMGSGSSFNRSYWKFHFVSDILLAECYEQDNGTPVYWVNGENVDAEAFAAFEAEQQAKHNTVWYVSWEDFVNPQSTSPELTAFGDVLAGSRDFIETYSGEHWDISRLSETITAEDIPCTVRQLAVVDLDQDGAQEAVLWLKLGQDDYAGFEVLRYQDGEVYGYSFSYRSFHELKEDGTFRASGGASYYSIGAVQFSDNSAVVTSAAERREEYAEDGISSMQYFINGEPVSEEDFQMAEQAQTAKPNVVWYESWEDFLAS